MTSKALQQVITCIADSITDAPTQDEHVICEALGRVAAVYLAPYADAEFEVWIKAVRDTRDYMRSRGQLAEGR